jgi:proteasome lid subunit RPN8/RPN11
MSGLTQIVIDRRVLDQFKRRSLRAYPNEHAEQLWGTIEGGAAHIYHIEPFDKVQPRERSTVGEGDIEEQKKDEVNFSFDQRCGTYHGKLRLLGSIHTHPAGRFGTEPSDEDIREAVGAGEIVWGIYAIRKTNRRRFISCRFWSTAKGQLDLVIAEQGIPRPESVSSSSS